ncbi:MAG: hypothetical protein KatS3mg014_2034 [Actinomycetota bacterium]|nr:MAG: hypothetical protein KatS3mg014_2034 [Actinomycetota bacterium]
MLSSGVGLPEGPVNIGDVAQLEAMLQRIRVAAPDVRPALVPNALWESLPFHLRGKVDFLPQVRAALAPDPPRAALRLPCAWALGPRGWPSWLAGVTVEMDDAVGVLAAGAGLFNDSYVAKTGLLWGTIFRLARARGLPVALSGQQVGPLVRPGYALALPADAVAGRSVGHARPLVPRGCGHAGRRSYPRGLHWG